MSEVKKYYIYHPGYSMSYTFVGSEEDLDNHYSIFPQS